MLDFKRQIIFFHNRISRVFKPLGLLVICCFLISGKPFQSDDDCINEVYMIYKKMDIKELDKGFVYMDFSMNTQYSATARTEAKTIKSNMEYIVGKKRMQYQTSDMKVLTDEIDNFTIIPSRKTIFWSNSFLNAGKDESTKGYSILQDSMFSSCKLISCKVENNKENTYNKVVVMEPIQNTKKNFPYNRITFYINTVTDEIKKVLILYPANSNFSQVEIIYNKVQYNYQNNQLNVPVKDLVFTANGNLQSEFKAFKLIDERVKSKNKK